jgi:hypothetical protein
MISPRLALCAAAAAALAGCNAGKSAVQRARLDCPPSQGVLTRTSVSEDGRICLYVGAGGDKVSLRLVPVTTTPQAALSPIEREVQALAAPAKGASEPAASDDDGDGDRAQVSLPGVRINASGDKAEVTVGSLHVDAKGNSAVVHQDRNVRLRGEALAFDRRGFRASYIVTRDDLPGGLAAIGYEAAGPRKGPLTVAVVQMSSHDGDKIHHEVESLVRRNGGV